MKMHTREHVVPSVAGHSKADYVLRDRRFFRGACLPEPTQAKVLRTHRLIYPASGPFGYMGWTIRAVFQELEGHPEGVYVRTTNWRYENEPGGFMKAQLARELYARLLLTGILKEELVIRRTDDNNDEIARYALDTPMVSSIAAPGTGRIVRMISAIDSAGVWAYQTENTVRELTIGDVI